MKLYPDLFTKNDEKLYFTDRKRFRSLVSGGENEQMAKGSGDRNHASS